mmetsp:Transcript_27446/g.44051  ORF Transcript_27446/g.44051 Transcript_27446/m.44051 type:complete len:141 (-) Transcript_27446:208-630(-)|eukprot:CAMPEP_0169117200 /NCGR_PEP_ID=MMETSP1015-20121227/30328_1 /TAXON_ID=342587 /ORGANISM="Karlodinium micrum, Strain CCMP2283" /LENGTH=140 /DNA_ID=CAMNT_0009179861 /DNA_START=81 /DNA_END=503 /DNA_ORIENTATION=+
MISTHVPDLLLGHTATAISFLVLALSILGVLALAGVMKLEKLGHGFHEALKSTARKEVKASEVDGANQNEGRRAREKKSRVSKFGHFFVGASVPRSGVANSSPYLLTDEVWRSPEVVPVAHTVEAYDLPDEVWTAPFSVE